MALNYLVLVLSYDTKCFWYAIKLELKVKVVFLSMEVAEQCSLDPDGNTFKTP